MGLRFRKSFKIAPGVRLNLSKSGTSWSLGKRGATLNLGKRSRATIGIPGTGLSYTAPLSGADPSAQRSASSALWVLAIFVAVILVIVVSI